MAKQRIGPGSVIDTLTPDEFLRMLPRPEEVTRIRVPGQVALDANGNGVITVYEVPAGYEFAGRRLTLDISTTDPVTGAVALNVAGKAIIYRRSGQRIEFGQPAYGPAVQVPGVQTWGDQQGPYLRNKETFEVQAIGLTANVILTATLEGLLRRPSSRDASA